MLIALFAALSALGFILAGSAVAATAPSITEFTIPSGSTYPAGIAMGPDNVLAFIETNTNKIGLITTDGSITEFTIPTARSMAANITLGPDSAFWFTEAQANKIGRITNSGIITEFSVPTQAGDLIGIAAGQDGALWFVENVSNKIGRITTGGVYSEYAVPTASAGLLNITPGPGDLQMWFTENSANKIGSIGTTLSTTSGQITEYTIPTPNAGPDGIVARSADFALWFTELDAHKIGRIGEDGTITEFPLSIPITPTAITVGADTALWFPEGIIGKIGRLFPNIVGGSPLITDYATPTSASEPLYGISVGGDNAVWFTENLANKIGRITSPLNTVAVTVTGSGQGEVTSSAIFGAPGVLVACGNGNTTCSINVPSGVQVSLFATAASGFIFSGFSGGGGSACQFTTPCDIVQLTGDVTTNAEFEPTPTTAMLSVSTSGLVAVTSNPSGINCGPTCNASFSLNTPITLTATATSGITFAGWNGGGCSGVGTCTVTLAQATTVSTALVADYSSDITLVSALLPTSRSVVVGSPASFFGTMINASTDTAGTNCTVAPTTSIPATFSFQTTDPATNARTGTANTPVTIAAGKSQSFFLELTPTAVFAPTSIAFSFTCNNASPAASNMGLNTLLLSGSATPVPDVIALAATASSDGIVDIAGASGTGAFAVATANVGTTGAITASANDGTANLPVTITICQTDPNSGQCFAAPSATVPTTINANATPTFSIFIKGSGTVPFQPAANRIFVQFQDAGGAVRGSTSVAVRTQ